MILRSVLMRPLLCNRLQLHWHKRKRLLIKPIIDYLSLWPSVLHLNARLPIIKTALPSLTVKWLILNSGAWHLPRVWVQQQMVQL